MKKSSFIVLVMALVVLTATSAFANNGNGTEFQGIYNRVIGWATGLPAIIFGLAVGILGALRGFQSGQYFWVFGGLVVAALVFVLPSIIQGMGGATF